jgi:hypothetical protein
MIGRWVVSGSEMSIEEPDWREKNSGRRHADHGTRLAVDRDYLPGNRAVSAKSAFQ